MVRSLLLCFTSQINTLEEHRKKCQAPQPAKACWALGNPKSISPVELEAGLDVKPAPNWRPLDRIETIWTTKESLPVYSDQTGPQ